MGLSNSSKSYPPENEDYSQYVKDIRNGKKQIIRNGLVANIDSRGVTYEDNEIMTSYILSKIPSNPQITYFKVIYRSNNS